MQQLHECWTPLSLSAGKFLNNFSRPGTHVPHFFTLRLTTPHWDSMHILKQTWLPLKQTCLSRKYWVCCNSELSTSISRQWGRSCPVTGGIQEPRPLAAEPTGSNYQVIGKHGQVEKRVCNGIPNQMLSSIFPSLFGSFVILFGSLTFVLCFVRLYKVWRAAG